MAVKRVERDWLSAAGARVWERLQDEDLLDASIDVYVGILSPEEAIGQPKRRDYPIIAGFERVVEARFKGGRGHAFTDRPEAFRGSMRDVLGMELEDNGKRAIFIAAINACLRYLGDVERTVHCRDEEPESCAREIAEHLRERHGLCDIGLIGCNPAIAEALVNSFGAERVAMSDLNPSNIGGKKFGVEVLDGRRGNAELARRTDVLVVTGTTLVNGTFEGIRAEAEKAATKLYLYGVTAAAVCGLFGLERLCFRGHDE